MAPAASKEDTCSRVILNFHCLCSLDYKVRHRPLLMPLVKLRTFLDAHASSCLIVAQIVFSRRNESIKENLRSMYSWNTTSILRTKNCVVWELICYLLISCWVRRYTSVIILHNSISSETSENSLRYICMNDPHIAIALFVLSLKWLEVMCVDEKLDFIHSSTLMSLL